MGEELRVVVATLAEQLRESSIVLHEGLKVTEIRGKEGVESIVLDDGTEVLASGIFIELGAKGAIELSSTLGVMLDAGHRILYFAIGRGRDKSAKGAKHTGACRRTDQLGP